MFIASEVDKIFFSWCFHCGIFVVCVCRKEYKSDLIYLVPSTFISFVSFLFPSPPFHCLKLTFILTQVSLYHYPKKLVPFIDLLL